MSWAVHSSTFVWRVGTYRLERLREPPALLVNGSDVDHESHFTSRATMAMRPDRREWSVDGRSAATERSPTPHAAVIAEKVRAPAARYHVGMARRPDVPADPAVVVVNPDDEVTPESFAAWLDRRQVGEPLDPGVKAVDTLAEARAIGEV